MKKLLLSLGVAVLVLSGCSVFPSAQKPQQNNPVDALDNQAVTTTSATDTVTGVSDWQTYQNDQLGFKFQYPKEWTAKVLNDTKWFHLQLASIDGQTKFDLHINYDKNAFSFPNSEYYFYVVDFTKEGKLEISAQSRDVIKSEVARVVARNVTSLPADMYVLMIYSYPQTSTATYDSKTFEKIISTFQLLK